MPLKPSAKREVCLPVREGRLKYCDYSIMSKWNNENSSKTVVLGVKRNTAEKRRNRSSKTSATSAALFQRRRLQQSRGLAVTSTAVPVTYRLKINEFHMKGCASDEMLTLQHVSRPELTLTVHRDALQISLLERV